MSNTTKIPLFRRFVLQNFPFIEEDFDALTDYALVSKIVEYLNTVINSQNEVTEQMEYVLNYFNNLDVQDEINNKIDQLIEDGTLEDLVGAYIQPRIDEQDVEISQIRNMVENTASGSPLVASSTAGMTDTSRVYVNTTDGNWYYYNGSQWTIGGVYQSSKISNGSIDVLMLDNNLKSNFFDSYSEPLNLGTAYTGFYKPDGTLTENSSFVNYHYSLTNGKVYTFNGENNHQCTGLLIKDSNNNVVFSSNNDTSLREDITCTFQCKENGLTAYISHSASYNDTYIIKYNTMLREMTGVYNMLKYTENVPLIQTIGGFVTALGAGQNLIRFSLGENYEARMYQMNAGRTYTITYTDYSNICDLLIATNDNQIIYASSTENIGNVYNPNTYTFTADTDGYILLTKFKAQGVTYTPTITVVNENIEINQSPLQNKTITYNGDSICAGAEYNGGYAKIIGDMFGMTVENIAVGGATIIPNTYTQIETPRHWISATITNMNSTYDYAIIEGGVNDASLDLPLGTISDGYDATLDTSTYYGAFENMLKQLINRFKGKKYGYIAVHQMTRNYRIINDPSTSYYWASRKCCEKWGVPFLDLNDKVPPFAFLRNTSLSNLPTTYTYNGDGWHPNEEGYKKYYVDKIVNWLESL